MNLNPDIIGYIANCFTVGSFVPQVLKTLRDRDTKSISLVMYTMFVCGTFLWMTYGFVIHNWPVFIGNIVTFILAGCVLRMKLKYK